jgi:hypothetical protein
MKTWSIFGNTAEPDMKEEMKRRKSQCDKIITLFESGKAITTVELMNVAANYTMRISDLRKKGHVITAEYVKPGVYHYTYVGNKHDD